MSVLGLRGDGAGNGGRGSEGLCPEWNREKGEQPISGELVCGHRERKWEWELYLIYFSHRYCPLAQSIIPTYANTSTAPLPWYRPYNSFQQSVFSCVRKCTSLAWRELCGCCCARKDTATPPHTPPPPLSLPIPPAVYPCLAPFHPSFPLPAFMLFSLSTHLYPSPSSFFHPVSPFFLPSHPPCPPPCLFSPSLLLSLALSFRGHFKWLQINQRHSTEFVSEPRLWEDEATHPGICHPHN